MVGGGGKLGEAAGGVFGGVVRRMFVGGWVLLVIVMSGYDVFLYKGVFSMLSRVNR